MKEICKGCGALFKTETGEKYCSEVCKTQSSKQRKRREEKGLCKKCKKCKTYVYKNSIQEGEITSFFEIAYCKENKEIFEKRDWTIQMSRAFPYVVSEKENNGETVFLESLLKSDPENIIYHVDRNLDFRMKNLREVFNKRDDFNFKEKVPLIRRGATSPFLGVQFRGTHIKGQYSRNPWSVVLKKNGKRKSLGVYPTELEAAHVSYTKRKEWNLPIGDETELYQTYLKWLRVDNFIKSEIYKSFDGIIKEYQTKIGQDIVNDYSENEENVKKEWYREVVKKYFREKYEELEEEIIEEINKWLKK